MKFSLAFLAALPLLASASTLVARKGCPSDAPSLCCEKLYSSSSVAAKSILKENNIESNVLANGGMIATGCGPAETCVGTPVCCDPELGLSLLVSFGCIVLHP